MKAIFKKWNLVLLQVQLKTLPSLQKEIKLENIYSL